MQSNKCVSKLFLQKKNKKKIVACKNSYVNNVWWQIAQIKNLWGSLKRLLTLKNIHLIIHKIVQPCNGIIACYTEIMKQHFVLTWWRYSEDNQNYLVNKILYNKHDNLMRSIQHQIGVSSTSRQMSILIRCIAMKIIVYMIKIWDCLFLRSDPRITEQKSMYII